MDIVKYEEHFVGDTAFRPRHQVLQYSSGFFVANVVLWALFLSAASIENSENEIKQSHVENVNNWLLEYLYGADSFTLECADTVRCQYKAAESTNRLVSEASDCPIDLHEVGADIFRSRCRHDYHRGCLLNWMDSHRTWSNCRRPISTDQSLENTIAKVFESTGSVLPAFSTDSEQVYFLVGAGKLEDAKAIMASMKMNIDSPTKDKDDRLIHVACEKVVWM